MPTAGAQLVPSKFMATSEDHPSSSENEKKLPPSTKQKQTNDETMNKLHYRRAVEADLDGNQNNNTIHVDSSNTVEAPSPSSTDRSCNKMSGAKEDEAVDNEDAKKAKLQNHQQQMRLLPRDFQLGRYDVWCGRGRQAKSAPGNLAYRQLVHDALERYSAATTKTEKGDIISGIIEIVRQKAHEDHMVERGRLRHREEETSSMEREEEFQRLGGFVKMVDGRWYEVGDFWAREKTSQCFRDALASKYSSAAASKYKRRRQIWHQHQDSPVTTSTAAEETEPDPPVTATTKMVSTCFFMIV
jgi:hypothetical protein